MGCWKGERLMCIKCHSAIEAILIYGEKEYAHRNRQENIEWAKFYCAVNALLKITDRTELLAKSQALPHLRRTSMLRSLIIEYLECSVDC